MGTRGIVGVVIDGTPKVTYNHFDSYPDGLGVPTLKALKEVLASQGVDYLRELARKVQLVDDQDKPTQEHLRDLAAYGDPHVGGPISNQTINDYYQLLRGLQGDLIGTLTAGVMIDSEAFPLDSLFCEWGYLVDLDNEVFEVYRGFQQSLPTEGYWKGRPTAEEDAENYAAHVAWCAENDRDPWQSPESTYKAIQRVAAWPLADLPDEHDFLAALHEGEDDE